MMRARFQSERSERSERIERTHQVIDFARIVHSERSKPRARIRERVMRATVALHACAPRACTYTLRSLRSLCTMCFVSTPYACPPVYAPAFAAFARARFLVLFSRKWKGEQWKR